MDIRVMPWNKTCESKHALNNITNLLGCMTLKLLINDKCEIFVGKKGTSTCML